jgi:glycosyltransferase involved in cell wall biosynthesis
VRGAGVRLPFDREDRLVRARRFDALAGTCGDFDLVHVQTQFGAHVAGVRRARRRRVPVVESYHTDFERYVSAYLPWLPRRLGESIARRFARRRLDEVDAVVVPSTALRAVLAGYGVARPIEVLPTGLPPSAFRPGDGDAFRRRLGLEAERPVALHVGRLGHEKNVRFLLDAFARVRRTLPAARLVVAGEGPARRELELRASALDLAGSVRFLGYLDRGDELADCYRAADAFLFASRTETQGLVLLEAMAQGAPVVALAEQGTRDLLSLGRGALVPADDVDDFAARAVALLADRAFGARLGREARETAELFAARHFAERLVELYGALLPAGE